MGYGISNDFTQKNVHKLSMAISTLDRGTFQVSGNKVDLTSDIQMNA